MNVNPFISIITVSYNSAQTIKDTIESVLNQSYSNIEYILIDGNSQDKTVDIIKLYKQKFKDKKIGYKWISEPDKGIYHAMNKGIKMSKGDIIGILNSDDWYSKDAISEIVSINKNNTRSVISGKKNKVNFQKEILDTVQNKKNVKKYIYKTMPLNHPATFVHKTIYEHIGHFDTQYKLSADYDFIFRAYKAGAKFLFTDKVIVNMRNTGSTYQLENIFITAKEDYEIRKKNKIKLAYFYYLKRLGFNYLLLLRNLLRSFNRS
jgi:glycosyltransferase involved in cell wall biosynthesis